MEQPQVDGVAMSYLLASVLANVFNILQPKWSNEYSFNKPKFYLTCVDDILAAFDKGRYSLFFIVF